MRALTERGLNRATLARQLLLRREAVTVVEAVRRVVAIQAQEPASPYLALWNRVADLDPAEVDAAFADHAVVKASLMRITLHAVHAEDHPLFHQAMAPSLRAARLNDRRFRDTGLGVDDADAVVPDLLELLAEPRTSAEVEAWMAERVGAAGPRLWWALRTCGPVVRVPSGGPWSHGGRSAFAAARTPPAAGDSAASVKRLVRRYLEGFGPASVQDIAQFTILRKPVVAEAVAAMAGSLRTFESPSGGVLHDVPDGPLPDESAPAPPRLMAMWDSSLLAYADRSRIIPPTYRQHVIRRNGDVLPTLLVDGIVAGVWRPVEGGIEARAFHGLPDDASEGLEAEASALAGFLADREPEVYRRYHRWWDSLPAGEVRRLGPTS